MRVTVINTLLQSRKLTDAEQAYPSHVLELLAVVHALRVFRHYLLGSSAPRPPGTLSDFTLRTDNQAVSWLRTKREVNRFLARWLDEMEEFRFEVDPADRAAVVARLQAQHMARGSDTEKPPPRYYGTPECPDLSRNAKVFAERRASRACIGCTPAQLEAQGPIPQWRCKQHGQDASDADRVRRVDGSGPATIHRR